MARHEVQWVKIGDKEIPAYKVICLECNKLQLATDFRTDVMPWIATCPLGHVFEVDPREDA